MAKTAYNWTFTSLGGAARVKIKSGADIAHLGELDRKLWTVLSCPAKNLEFDQKTLDLIDADHEGNIRSDEVVAAAEWLTSVIKDKDLLLTRGTEIPFSAFNEENPEGATLNLSRFAASQDAAPNQGPAAANKKAREPHQITARRGKVGARDQLNVRAMAES